MVYNRVITVHLCYSKTPFSSPFLCWGDFFSPTTSKMPFGNHISKSFLRTFSLLPDSPGWYLRLMVLRAMRCWTGWNNSFSTSVCKLDTEIGEREGGRLLHSFRPAMLEEIAQQSSYFVSVSKKLLMPESRIKHNRAIPSNLCFARSEIMFSTVADDGGQGERKKKKGRKSSNSFNNRFFLGFWIVRAIF